MSSGKLKGLTLSPAVLIDEHRHTAIRVGETKRGVALIPLEATGLQVVHLSHDQYAENWAAISYPLDKAVRIYLDSEVGNSANTSSEARGYLEAILESVKGSSNQPQTSHTEKEDIMATATKTTAAKKAPAKTPAKAAAPAKASKAAAPAKASAAAKKPAAAPAKAAKPAKKEGRGSYAGKQIVHKVKSVADAGLREGSNRAKMLAFVLKHTETDKVLGHDIGDGTAITGANLAGMVERGHIVIK